MTNPDDPMHPQTVPVMAPEKSIVQGVEVPTGVLRKVGEQFTPGLTKREYFAAMAMQGLIQLAAASARTSELDNLAEKMGIDLCPIALIMADALIANLNKDPK